MLKFAISSFDGPIAIRYPRGTAYDGLQEFRQRIEAGKGEKLREGDDVAILATGSMVETGDKVRTILEEKNISCSLINARFIKPIDKDMVLSEAKNCRLIVTLEENVQSGGFGEKVLSLINENRCDKSLKCEKVLNITIPDKYVEHGNPDVLKQELGIDAPSVAKKVLQELS